MTVGTSGALGAATALYSQTYVDELKAKIAELEKTIEWMHQLLDHNGKKD